MNSFAALLKETINSVQGNEQQDDADHIDEELENIIAHPAPAYDQQQYWETRYERDPEELDWYQTWDSLKPVIGKLIPESAVVLSVGCGNSPMSSAILKDGAQKVYGIDFSQTVIDQMKAQYESEPNLIWVNGDITKMAFEDNFFDFIFDKGTIDCFVASTETTKKINDALSEISRVLKPGGYFVQISYGTPNTRTPFLKHQNLNWTLTDTKEVEKPNEPGTFHYVYIVQKKQE